MHPAKAQRNKWYLRQVQLCKLYPNGNFRKGDSCSFAHSLADLRPHPKNWPLATTHIWTPGVAFPEGDHLEAVELYMQLDIPCKV